MAPFAALLLASFHGISETSEMRDKSSESRACALGKSKRAKKKNNNNTDIEFKGNKNMWEILFSEIPVWPRRK